MIFYQGFVIFYIKIGPALRAGRPATDILWAGGGDSRHIVCEVFAHLPWSSFQPVFPAQFESHRGNEVSAFGFQVFEMPRLFKLELSHLFPDSRQRAIVAQERGTSNIELTFDNSHNYFEHDVFLLIRTLAYARLIYIIYLFL